jgi:16S rRNA (guanine527-N7)-methyltransferase
MPAPPQVVDVGSGGGYPGLVIAAVLPGTCVQLIEPLQKRARLLIALAADLGLANVAVHAARAEEAGRSGLRDTAALVTARAVAPLAELVEYTAPFAAPGGTIALPKGSGLRRELADAGRAIATLNCELVGQAPMRESLAPAITVLFLRKAGPTPDAYPRRAGVPRRQPLKG